MVPVSESVLYRCTVFLIALIFLTDASSAINESLLEMPSPTQRPKYASNRGGRGMNSVKNQNQDATDLVDVGKQKSNESQPFINYAFRTEREILSLSGSGRVDDVKENATDGEKATDDEKTLSEQVADGKYGLIQNEIFTARPSRLGVLSYDANPEVPKDNINNLGGLGPDDIWLAENHLLVVAGNSLNGLQNDWRPIDDYAAPSRPVQIPPNPKVPPPFPVQLTDNGPVEYVKSSNVRPSKPFYNPLLMYNKSQSRIPYYGFNVAPPKSRLTPLPPPAYVKPPLGAEFLPSYLTNVSAPQIDDDDPSIHYPPPYDFHYPLDNTTRVPPGPLVPGIVLPPPVNFFSPLGNDTKARLYLKPARVKSAKQLHFPAQNPPALATFIAYGDDDAVNDVSYPSLDVKIADDEEWIPIPAPKPFYITGEMKPTGLLKIPPRRPTFKYLQHAKPLVDELLYTTTASPRPIDNTLSSTRSNGYSASFVRPNIKATYYFYEEPPSNDATTLEIPISTTTRPVDVDNNILYDITSAKGSADEKRRKPIPLIPSLYYLAALGNSETAKPTAVSYLDIQRPHNSPAYSVPKLVDNRPPKPLFEYDYVASDYNRKPMAVAGGAPFVDYPSYPSFENYHRLPEFNAMFRYPKPEVYPTTTTGPLSLLHYPSYSSYEPNWLPMFNYYQQFAHPTENPYYDYFTKEDGDLVDDKTKTYFTIFGQKLRQNVESTTPLAAPSSANPTFVRPHWKQTYRPRPSQSLTASSSSSFVDYSQESAEANTKPPSLEGDTLVNYVTPNPTPDPDAEYVTPATKYIRPIVVEDLPADLQERLQNALNVRQRRKNTSSRDTFRYTLVDYEPDNSPSRGKVRKHSVGDGERADVPAPVSLHGDIRVNYQHGPQLTINQQAEYVDLKTPKSRQRLGVTPHSRSPLNGNFIPTSREHSTVDSRKAAEESHRNVISYKYPPPAIERGNFYFLFPGGTSLSQIENEQRDFQSDAEKRGGNFKRKLRDVSK